MRLDPVTTRWVQVHVVVLRPGRVPGDVDADPDVGWRVETSHDRVRCQVAGRRRALSAASRRREAWVRRHGRVEEPVIPNRGHLDTPPVVAALGVRYPRVASGGC